MPVSRKRKRKPVPKAMTATRTSDNYPVVLPGVRCRDCGSMVDAASGVTKDGRDMDPALMPTDGNVSVCLYCGTVAIYEQNATVLRAPTPEEMSEIMAEESVARLILATAQATGRMTLPRAGRRKVRKASPLRLF